MPDLRAKTRKELLKEVLPRISNSLFQEFEKEFLPVQITRFRPSIHPSVGLGCHAVDEVTDLKTELSQLRVAKVRSLVDFQMKKYRHIALLKLQSSCETLAAIEQRPSSD